MPIAKANDVVSKDQEDLTKSWLDPEAIKSLFNTEIEKSQLSALQTALKVAMNKNESEVQMWRRVETFKDIAIKLLKKCSGIP